MRNLKLVFPTLLTLSLGLGACSDDDSKPTPTSPDTSSNTASSPTGSNTGMPNNTNATGNTMNTSGNGGTQNTNATTPGNTSKSSTSSTPTTTTTTTTTTSSSKSSSASTGTGSGTSTGTGEVVPAPYKGKKSNVDASDLAAVARGKTILENNCGCHGNDGAGGSMNRPNLIGADAKKWADDWFLWKVSEGVGKNMPAFKAKLTENQIWELWAHLRSKQPK